MRPGGAPEGWSAGVLRTRLTVRITETGTGGTGWLEDRESAPAGLVSGWKAGAPDDDLRTQVLCPDARVRLPAARAGQELCRVYGLVMPPQLEVEMRPGGPACIADVSDHVVAGNALARLDVELV